MGERAPLTDAERRVYELLRAVIGAGGAVPSRQEMADRLGFASDRAVSYHVEHLEEKGYLRRTGGHRGIELTDDPSPSLPLIGVVAAGSPLPPGDDQGRFRFHDEFPDPDLCVLRVKGASMIEDQIASGDYVLVRRDPDPPTGAKVVCSIDGELTLKRLGRVGKKSVLLPANRDMKPIPLREDENTFIVGVLVGVVRKC